MIFQLCESLSNVILGFCKRIRRFPQDLLVFFWKIRVKNQGNFFHQIFGQATFVDKMKTLLTDTYGFGPSNLIMSRNCETLFIPPLHQFYRPYDLKNLYFLAFCGIGQHKSTFVDQTIFCWKLDIHSSFWKHFLPCTYF